ncbi:putative AC transposase [Fusarium oxysporum f. sp. rapae]|uniref:Putative AC transposase n=1 Tax=Fusarium oxysporum f. sp. rapae TaxID=485398 RepID=A0A8J5NNA5_FUSOX|nr:putative AC transposase [Fusarium oxysporum f. sp. rapae]
MPFSQDSLSLTVPTTPSTPNLSLPAPSVASSAPPSIASIPTEKLSIWTFFRYARGSEPGFRPKERSDRSGKSSNKRLHYCIACWDKKKSWSTIYTSGARDHLRLNHPSLWKRWLDMQDRQTSSKPKLMPGQQVMNSFLLQKDEASRELVLREAYDRPRHLQALLTLCARRKLPLNAIEWPELHDLLLSANPEISDLAQFSRRTFTRALVLNYERYRQILQNNIQEAIGDVHISTDMWTSPARKAYLCICVRWISQDYQFKHGMLALPQVLFSHSGEIQAAIILRTLKSFGITTKLGYHTGDNATSNDTLLIELSRSLRLEFGIDYDPTTHRIRCLDHILNLALQAFLLATSKEALKAALAAIEETEDTDPYELFSAYLDVPVVEDNPASIRAHEQAQRRGGNVKAKHKGFEGWGATTALQKLHNLAVWLRNSSIHHDRWIEAVGITLGIDNDTRWSSWYHLIKRTTRKEREIKDFIDKHPECDNFRLNGVEWDTLKRTERFLSVFASGTLWVEGSEASLSQSLTLMDAILTFFEDQKVLYKSGPEKDLRMVHSIEMGWFILDKYYALVESTPVYAAAMLLDPSKRKHYLLQNWPEEWHQNTIDAAYSIWQKEYAHLPHESLSAAAAAADIDTFHPSSKKRVENELDRLKRRLRVQPTSQEDEDMFMAFIEDKTIDLDALKITPLQWWLVPEQRRRYPRLHRMAINILSIAPSSAEPEQQFSGARRTQSWDRLRLSPENLQRLECMGNWFARKLISSEELLMMMVEAVDMEDEMNIDFDEEDWGV